MESKLLGRLLRTNARGNQCGGGKFFEGCVEIASGVRRFHGIPVKANVQMEGDFDSMIPAARKRCSSNSSSGGMLQRRESCGDGPSPHLS